MMEAGLGDNNEHLIDFSAKRKLQKLTSSCFSNAFVALDNVQNKN